MLGFGVVPSNVLPKAPVQDLIDNHMWVNRIYRKLQRQSENQKSLLLHSNTASDDAAKIKSADDGEIVPCDQPDSVKERGFRGPNQALQAIAMQIEKTFNEQAGNLEMMGGLSAQSATATQDKMLNANASQVVANMQAASIGLAVSACKALCWFWHHNPHHTMRTMYEAPNAPEFGAQQYVTPEDRGQIPFEELDIKVDVYSMQPTTPMARLQSITQVLGLIQPFMGMAQQQGIMLDLNTLMDIIGKYGDMPELKEFLTTTEPPPPSGGGGSPEEGAAPASTTRNYVRESTSTRTNDGDRRNMMSALMGVDTGGNPYEGEEK
jgi:hypothetical protein